MMDFGKAGSGLHIDSDNIDIAVNPLGESKASRLFCAASICKGFNLLGFIYYYGIIPVSPDLIIKGDYSEIVLSDGNENEWRLDIALFTEPGARRIYDALYWLPVEQRIIDCDLSTGDDFLYEMETDTFLDHTNTVREGQADLPAFQNNILFRIENTGTGEASITDLAVNGRSWWTLNGILRDAGLSDSDDSVHEQIKKLWDFSRKKISCGKTYQHLFAGDMSKISIVDFFNGLGTGACGTYSSILALLCAYRGIPARRASLSDGSHVITQTMAGDSDFVVDAFYGPDEEGSGVRGSFFVNENGQPASYEDLCRDHYLVNRAGRLRIGELASLFGYHDSWQSNWLREYSDKNPMGITLFAGETVEWRMHPVHAEKGNPARQTGVFRLSGNLAGGRFFPSENLTIMNDTAVSENSASLGCRISLPYPIYGINAALRLARGRIVFEIVTEKGSVSREYALTQGEGPMSISIIPDESDRAILFDDLPGSVELRIISGESTEYTVGCIEFLFHAYGKSLMSLKNGRNTCLLKFSGKEGVRQLSLTHNFLEFPKAGFLIPGPPRIAMGTRKDENGYAMNVLNLQNRIPQTSSADGILYDYIVSDDPDSLIPASPLYQGLTPAMEVPLSNAGLLKSGINYFARVRSINAAGAAGPWCRPFAFIPESLPTPVWDETEFLGDGVILHWIPSGGSDETVLYDIYGSREQGFRPSKTPYDVWIKRTGDPSVSAVYPANYIGTTSEASFAVKYNAIKDAGSFPAHFRIIPHTSRLTGSPGTMLSLKTPFILGSSIIPKTLADKPYSCFITAILSLGSLHFNRLPEKPMYTEFLNKEIPVFELAENPSWLSIRPHDGYIFGTPGNNDRGVHRFTISCTTHKGTHSVETSIEVI
ncbi:MAG: hypothetical protein JXB33_06925 [Clostridia bacterium]|nr:hypothetical protein [Clostridia bacterium]